MVNNYTIKTTYYDRKMDEKLLTQINELCVPKLLFE